VRSLNAKSPSFPGFAIWTAVLLFVAPGAVNADLPISAAIPMIQEVRRDFASIHQFRMVSLTGENDGPKDLIVSGKRFRNHGWHVEAFRMENGKLIPRWDSEQFAQGTEFNEVRTPRIRIWNLGHDYGVLVEGCEAKRCSSGSIGYLWFSGSTGVVAKAKATVQGLDKPVAGSATYLVEFSPSIDEESQHALEEAICSDSAIGNKLGLPFPCTTRWRQRGGL
jgi:hypothetical protein